MLFVTRIAVDSFYILQSKAWRSRCKLLKSLVFRVVGAILAGWVAGIDSRRTGSSRERRMTNKSLGVLILLLAPAAVAYLAGYSKAAHYVGLGVVLALQLSVLARPVAVFAFLLPVVYAAAAITAQSTDAVVALIVAVAAAVGAASSQGLHRGLVALLAAALLGSFEPAGGAEVVARSGFLLAGCAYGFLLAVTVLRGVTFGATPLYPQAALGYAALLAVLTLVAWFAARIGGLAYPWWLPLVAVAVSEPLHDGSARQALVRSVLAATAAMLLILVIDGCEVPALRALLLVGVLFITLSAGARRPSLAAVLIVPVLVLLSSHAGVHESPLEFLQAALPVFVPVIVFSALGHWLLWTLRSGTGRVAA
jgi:hypothetical protein